MNTLNPLFAQHPSSAFVKGTFVHTVINPLSNHPSSPILSFCEVFKLGRAASGGALAPQPPRATGVGPESLRLCPFPGGALFLLFSRFFEIGLHLRVEFLLKTDSVSLSDLRSGGSMNLKPGRAPQESDQSPSDFVLFRARLCSSFFFSGFLRSDSFESRVFIEN